MLELKGVTKSYGALTANDAVSLDVDAGEIHALLGENGAGKSTLMKILYGAATADAGEILWFGAPVRIANPAAARALGIGMVFQHFSLFDALTVAENIALAAPPQVRLSETAGLVREVSKRYGLPLDPEARIADLSAGERQRVEIVRCLLQDPKLIILDEPTSVLTPQEAEELFLSLERLAAEDRGILYISHKLEEVRRLCRRATILRRGKVVATCDPRETSAAEIAQLMVGAEVGGVKAAAGAALSATPSLRVAGLSLRSETPFGVSLAEIDFAVYPGEVRAIAGVAGNGQSELFEALSGERLAPSDGPGPAAMTMLGEAVDRLGVVERRKLGAAFVSEERLGHGAAPDRRLSENVLLTRGRTDAGLNRAGFLNFRLASTIKERICAAFDVRRGAPDPTARALSGGNLQKFIVGREVDRSPKLLVIDQPTWGVDAGAAAHIRQTLVDLARNGAAVLAISQDLDEIFEIADQVAVLAEGRLSPFTPVAETSREAIGLLMTNAPEATGRSGPLGGEVDHAA